MRHLLLTILAALLSGGVLAASVPPPTPEEAELLALLDTPISVAGKSQKISDAPAIISVLTADDIRRMGHVSVFEALSYIPGINLTETSFGYTALAPRGNLEAHYNNKWLFRLNGHPMFKAVTGDSDFNGVPLAQIKRIEVLRGPGPAMYGTNAFTGVVDITTFDGTEDHNEFTVGYGSFGEFGTSGRTAVALGKFHVSVAASGSRTDGYDYRVIADENGRAGSIDYRNDNANVNVSGGMGGWRFSLGSATNTKDKFGLIPTLVSSGERKTRQNYADTGFGFAFTEKLSFDVSAYWDVAKQEDLMGWYPPAWASQQAGVGGPEIATSEGAKAGIVLKGTYQFTPTWSVTGGLVGETLSVEPYEWRQPDGTFSAFNTSAWHDSYSSNTKSAYAQVDGRLAAKVGIVAGLRYTKSSVYGETTSPNFGLVFNATDKLTFKALYGNGSRDPNFFELYVATANVVNGNVGLTPEKVTSYEIGMDYLFGTNSFRVNAFRADTKDLIARALVAPAGINGNTRDTPMYGNVEGQELTGLEAELKGSFYPGSFHFINVSLLKGTEKATNTDVLFIPKVLANVGFTMPVVTGLTVSPYVQHVGKKEGSLLDGTPVEVDAYTLVNANVKYQWDRVWVTLTGKNLTNETYAYPEYIRRLVPSTPGGPGRSFHVQLGVGF